jgi:hypothetical protein
MCPPSPLLGIHLFFLHVLPARINGRGKRARKVRRGCGQEYAKKKTRLPIQINDYLLSANVGLPCHRQRLLL